MTTRVSELIHLRGGFVVPEAALRLAWNLEERGFRLAADGADLVIVPGSRLTPNDVASVRHHKPDLLAIARYCGRDDLDRHLREEHDACRQ
jgi:hypothetical protein